MDLCGRVDGWFSCIGSCAIGCGVDWWLTVASSPTTISYDKFSLIGAAYSVEPAQSFGNFADNHKSSGPGASNAKCDRRAVDWSKY